MRNAEPWLPLFRRQLALWMLQPVAIIAGVNSPEDGTEKWLWEWAAHDKRVRPLHFTPDPPLTEKALARAPSYERFAYFAGVWNRVIEAALEVDSWDFAYLTSVQKFTPPEVVGSLVETIQALPGAGVLAPILMFAEGPLTFYETFCTFSLAGVMFRPEERPGWQPPEEVAAVGGTHLVARAVFEAGARQAGTDGTEGETVPFCRMARKLGYTVWFDRRQITWSCWNLRTMTKLVEMAEQFDNDTPLE